jgi:hypothetical protein
MIKHKKEVDRQVLDALTSGVIAWESWKRSNVEDWYRDENLTLKLAQSAMVEFCTLTWRGSRELLEAYNHLVDFANQQTITRVEDIFNLDVEIPLRVSDPMELSGKTRILVELWDERKDSKFFADLISYGDKLGVYDLAMLVAYGEFQLTEAQESVVNEIWDLLLKQLRLADLYLVFDYLEDLLYEASSNGVDYSE